MKDLYEFLSERGHTLSKDDLLNIAKECIYKVYQLAPNDGVYAVYHMDIVANLDEELQETLKAE